MIQTNTPLSKLDDKFSSLIWNMEPNYLTKVRKETIIYLLKTLMVWEMKKLTIETIYLLWTNE